MSPSSKSTTTAMQLHSSTASPEIDAFGKISEKRLAAGFSIERLCAEAGISCSTYFRISAGRTHARPSTLRKMEKALHRLESEALQ